jgi:hypothetical protein
MEVLKGSLALEFCAQHSKEYNDFPMNSCCWILQKQLERKYSVLELRKSAKAIPGGKDCTSEEVISPFSLDL